MIDISENLTPNAAQAVQYIGRSCRMDGHNKGDTLEDLNKAIWFIQREIARRAAESNSPALKAFRKIQEDISEIRAGGHI